MIITCNCEFNCIGKSVIASIIIGVIAAILSFTGVITLTPAFLWVLFGIAVGFLGLTLVTPVSESREATCCCRNLKAFFAGILGTILTSVILLGVTFAATSILVTIITGALLFFFSLLVTSATCLIACRFNCN